jgi:hypothetical protein
MDYLPACMDARVRASGGDDVNRVVQNTAESRGDLALHTGGIFLLLPAGESAAVVFQTDGKTRHQ